jgi:hypothetical protein
VGNNPNSTGNPPLPPKPRSGNAYFSKEFADLAAQLLGLGTQHAGGDFTFSAAAPAASAPTLTPSMLSPMIPPIPLMAWMAWMATF